MRRIRYSRPRLVQKPEGTVRCEYGADRQLASISFLGETIHYEHDTMARLKSVASSLGTWQYRYNDAGQRAGSESSEFAGRADGASRVYL